MLKISKYPFWLLHQMTNGLEITVPEGSRILSAQLEFGEPVLWVLQSTEPDLATEFRRIFCYRTDVPVKEFADFSNGTATDMGPGDYIGSIHYCDHTYHVFASPQGGMQCSRLQK